MRGRSFVLKILTVKDCLISCSSLSHSQKLLEYTLNLNISFLACICPVVASLRRHIDGFLRLGYRILCAFRKYFIHNIIDLNMSSTRASKVERFAAQFLITFLARCTLPCPSYSQDGSVLDGFKLFF